MSSKRIRSLPTTLEFNSFSSIKTWAVSLSLLFVKATISVPRILANSTALLAPPRSGDTTIGAFGLILSAAYSAKRPTALMFCVSIVKYDNEAGLCMSTVINRFVPTFSTNLATKAVLTTSPSKNSRSWREYAIYGIIAHTFADPSSEHLFIIISACKRCLSVGGYVDCTIMQ